jgi:stage V sporulation protein AC
MKIKRGYINMESEEKKKEYNEYVERITPNNNLAKNMFNAFWIGGLICAMGQLWLEIFQNLGVGKEDASSLTTLVLILESVVLTGLGLYPKIAKVGGAGCLVPITGFANGVVSPAIEFKTEGQVFGVGAKIFTIAGPVILYGILSSWIAGVIYMILNLMGIVG